ncbi:MAG: LysM peptidoglycan-binding domain-containing protein [Desulfobacula sp.]|uniref:lytic transglycosylase domain-containing protein n=1 Tax=Desulfobacula sp. TaxID=2593537 RepID=UPI0025BA890E|nr:LysM peptidoglycan-binding domain-containing protein [Desulfobacula sp.]MCD4722420.1 LysM peptidoglycan-binding domain-containing protein [Desulfobacula sp.]
MLNYKLAIILILFWITAGCQHSYNKNTSDQHVKIQTASSELLKADINSDLPDSNNKIMIADSLEEQDDNKEPITISDSSLQNPCKEDSLTSDLEKEKENQESEITVQEKIDQALELCSYAQQMWEEGKLEEAVTNLDSAYYSILEIDSEVYPEFNQQKEDIRYLISKRILEIYASRQIVVNGQYNEIPIILNQHVQKEIKRFTGPERKFFIQSLERANRFRPFIVFELKKAGLPEDLSWLPLVESGFKIRALSPARALGLWQFIPSTGYKFGLSRNYYIDERLDPEKATIAAIAYLKVLHNLFGDWTTALAAYNCGESRVLRTIRKQRINYLDNFWDLYQSLPRETSRYVPRFLATLHIINNLEKYNIKIDNPLLPVEYKICEIKKQVRLKDIAKEIGVNTTVLKNLNPELRYALLPPESYLLKIPEDKAQLFLSKIDKIKTTYSPPPMVVYHRVRRGDTLSGIAKKYRTSIRAISAANHINKSHRIIAGKVLKIPSRAGGAKINVPASQPLSPGQTLTYIVRRGDNLWIIARKFGTTTKTIMAANKLSGTTLSIGQTLYITSKQQLKIVRKGTATYKVRSGDSPFTIAKKYNMDLNRLLALNRLSKRSKIFPGQKLIVE